MAYTIIDIVACACEDHLSLCIGFEPFLFTIETWPLKSISVCGCVVFRLRLLCEISDMCFISARAKWIYVNAEHTINMKLSKNQMMKAHTLTWSHYVHAVQGRYSLQICILLYSFSFSRRSSCNENVLLRITCNVGSLLSAHPLIPCFTSQFCSLPPENCAGF